MRNVRKAIKQYNDLFCKPGTISRGAAFYSGEYKQLHDMSADPWEIMDNAVRFAFIVGMKYGVRKTKV